MVRGYLSCPTDPLSVVVHSNSEYVTYYPVKIPTRSLSTPDYQVHLRVRNTTQELRLRKSSVVSTYVCKRE